MLKGGNLWLRHVLRGAMPALFFILGAAHGQIHSADLDADNRIALSELMRLVQFYNAGGYQCAEGTEDGFAPGPGPSDCVRHDADFANPPFAIDLSELLRVIQLFNANGYFACAGLNPPSEDDFCAGDRPPFVILTAGDSLEIPEGATQTLEVTLSAPPAELTLVSAALGGADSDLAIASGQSLAFDSATYNIPQTITLSAAQDADATNGTDLLRLTAPGVPEKLVVLQEQDDDTIELLVNVDQIILDEADTVAITIALTAAPEENLVVNTARTDGDTDILVTGGQNRTFTPQNFSVPQQAFLSAAEDDDDTDGTATVTVSAPGVDPVQILVTERDNDREVVVVSSGTLTVPEGGTITFSVRLNIPPASPRSITIGTDGGDPDLTVTSAVLLEFDAANFAIEQTVVVAAAEDLDSTNGETVFTLSGDGVSPVDVTAREADNDTGNRIGDAYTAVPLATDTFDFLGFSPEACEFPVAPLTFSGGSSLARARGFELETGRRVVLPALGLLGDAPAENATVFVQNAGDEPSTYALVTLDGAGTPVAGYCSGVVQPGAQWPFSVPLLFRGDAPGAAQSGIVYALPLDAPNLALGGDTADLCAERLAALPGDALALDAFEADFLALVNGGEAGERAAVVVQRGTSAGRAPDAGIVHAVYNGLSDRMYKTPLGVETPLADYLVPFLRVDDGVESYIHVYNDSDTQATLAVTLTSLDGTTANGGGALAAGATATYAVRDLFGGAFVGSAVVASDVPVAVVGDVLSEAGGAAAVAAARVDAPAIRIQTPIPYDEAYTHTLYVTNLDASASQVTVAFVDEQATTLGVFNEFVAAGRTTTFSLDPEDVPAGGGPGLVIAQTEGAGIVGVLLRTRIDGVNVAPLAFDVSPMLGQGAVFDAADGPGTGAKLLFLPVFGQGASSSGLNSEILITNANVTPGRTAYAVYTYDSTGVHEYACGLLRGGRTDRIVPPRDELGDGYVGALVIAALASNQSGGPGLVASLRNDAAPVEVVDAPESPGGTTGDVLTALAATPAEGIGRYGRGAPVLHLPVLNASDGGTATPRIAVQNASEDEARVTVVYLDADGIPLVQADLPSASVLLTAHAAAVFDQDIPMEAAAATICAFESGDVTLSTLADAVVAGGDAAAYRALVAQVEAASSAAVTANVIREGDTTANLSGYAGIGGIHLGVEDPLSRGYAYTAAVVQGGLSGQDTTVFVQNAGLSPTMIELSLRRPGRAAQPVASGPLNVEGGDLSRRLGPIAPGATTSFTLSGLFGTFDTGRLVLQASEALAVVTDASRGLSATTAFPVALNYTSNHFSAFAKVSGLTAYAPLVTNPASGADVRVSLQDLLDLGTSLGATARLSVFSAGGDLVAESLVELAPFESTTVQLSPLVDLQGPGWARVELAGDPTSFPAVVQGTLAVTESDGGSYAYPLLPEEVGGAGFTFRQTLSGVLETDTLHVLNPADTASIVTFEFYDAALPSAEGERASDANVTISVNPGNVRALRVQTISEIPEGFVGGVTVVQDLPSADSPGVLVVAAP